MKKKTKARGKVTIGDIAEICGLSSMTVSRALRSDGKIKPETRERILEVAHEIGYFRNTRQGRPAMVQEDAPKIQVIIGSLGANPSLFHWRLLGALEQQLSRLGYDCLIRYANGEYDTFMRLLHAARRTEAMETIAIGDYSNDQLQSLQNAFPGLLLLDNPGVPDNTTYSSFAFDNALAAQLAVEHLIACERRRILLLGGPKEHFFTAEIEEGYRRTLARHGLKVDPTLIRYTDFSAEAAADELDKILCEIDIDAVFTNDEMASGVYRVLMEHRRSIPNDVAVCGCDNLPSGKQFYPPLTTISLDYDELAAQAVRYIEQRQTKFVPMRTRLAPSLVVRRSTIIEF